MKDISFPVELWETVIDHAQDNPHSLATLGSCSSALRVRSQSHPFRSIDLFPQSYKKDPAIRCRTFISILKANPHLVSLIITLTVMAWPYSSEPFLPDIISTLQFTELKIGSRNGCLLYSLLSSEVKRAVLGSLPRLSLLHLYALKEFAVSQISYCENLIDFKMVDVQKDMWSMDTQDHPRRDRLQTLSLQNSTDASTDVGPHHILMFFDLKNLHRLSITSVHPQNEVLQLMTSCSPALSSLSVKLEIADLGDRASLNSFTYPRPIINCPRLQNLQFLGSFSKTSSSIPLISTFLPQVAMPILAQFSLALDVQDVFRVDHSRSSLKPHASSVQTFAHHLSSPSFGKLPIAVGMNRSGLPLPSESPKLRPIRDLIQKIFAGFKMDDQLSWDTRAVLDNPDLKLWW